MFVFSMSELDTLGKTDYNFCLHRHMGYTVATTTVQQPVRVALMYVVFCCAPLVRALRGLLIMPVAAGVAAAKHALTYSKVVSTRKAIFKRSSAIAYQNPTICERH